MNDLQQRFRATMARLPSGVVVVTTVDEHGQQQGFTATSFSSLSMEPPSVLVCLANSALCFQAFIRSRYFAVNFIDASDGELALKFARRGEQKFSGVDLWHTETGMPILRDSVAFMECQTDGHYSSGDHAILVGNVRDTHINRDTDVLVHYRRGFGRVDLESAGRNADWSFTSFLWWSGADNIPAEKKT